MEHQHAIELRDVIGSRLRRAVHRVVIHLHGVAGGLRQRHGELQPGIGRLRCAGIRDADLGNDRAGRGWRRSSRLGGAVASRKQQCAAKQQHSQAHETLVTHDSSSPQRDDPVVNVELRDGGLNASLCPAGSPRLIANNVYYYCIILLSIYF